MVKPYLHLETSIQIHSIEEVRLILKHSIAVFKQKDIVRLPEQQVRTP